MEGSATAADLASGVDAEEEAAEEGPDAAATPAAPPDGGCWASTLARAGVFSSVGEATPALNAQIDPVWDELRRGGRPNATREDAGVPEKGLWHPRVVDKAAWKAGYRITKVPIDPTHKEPVDLRRLLQQGTYAIEGIQNKVYYHGAKKEDRWGKGVVGPERAPADWRHVACVKDGVLLDWEFDEAGVRHADGGAMPLSVLWLRAGNAVVVKMGYFRSILKVYRIERRVEKRAASAPAAAARERAR